MEKGRVSVMKQGRRGEKRRRQSIVFLRTLKLNFIIVAGISICLLLLSYCIGFICSCLGI